MHTYGSIETLYIRDKETNQLDFHKIRQPEWAFIKGWTLTEKIDGTNIRVIVSENDIQIKGRSDNANLPPNLETIILLLFPPHQAIVDYFGGLTDRTVTFYGEGYGPGIQGSDPMQYRNKEQGKMFRCFDILRKGNIEYWLSTEEQVNVCESLSIPYAPVLGSIYDVPIGRSAALAMLDGFAKESSTAVQDSGNVVVPEGVVARTPLPLMNQFGSRVMWKLTRREFK